jgi:3-oxoacyl-[acyl-carrier-protein] synthase-1
MKHLGTIVGVGMRTGIGLDALSTALVLRTGVPAIRPSPLADPAGEPVSMAFDSTLDPMLVGEERAARLGGLALRDLARVLGPKARSLRTRFAVAFPEPRPDQSRGEAGKLLATAFRTLMQETFGAPPVDLSMKGSAGLAAVLPAALAELAAGTVDAVVAGGLHSDYDPEAIRALAAAGRLFSAAQPDAVLPGEAAAFVLVMRDDMACSLGLEPLARVHAIGADVRRSSASEDGHSFDSTALSRAIRAATDGLDDGMTVGWSMTDLGLEHARVREVYSAVTRVHARLGPPLVIDSPAQRAGHLGAAGLALAVGTMALGFRHGFAPAPLGLALAASDGGERAAILVGQP